uniref:Retrovirus-related Pol polyprotein from transposon TNT 1-94 n=1 Tax=Tanacetum cinerariifolium TaxID=118510 RepID=A0A699HKI1_TANCI|nr:hypothetical protein [Tanacetum cinerariifolium]
MLKIGQRAWSYADKDLGYLLSSESSATREYLFVIQTYFDTHTVDGVFMRDEERLLYLQSQHEVGSGSKSGGGRDDKPGDDEDAGEKEDEENDDCSDMLYMEHVI